MIFIPDEELLPSSVVEEEVQVRLATGPASALGAAVSCVIVIVVESRQPLFVLETMNVYVSDVVIS